MTADVARHVIIRGRVQGVGFRVFVEIQAERHAVRGWVRNRRDNSVEAVFSGPAHSVDEIIAACWRGPPSARVDHVEISEASARDLALGGAGVQFATLTTI